VHLRSFFGQVQSPENRYRIYQRATIPRMENLNDIMMQLQAERDRIDAAIKVLRGIGAISGKQGKRRTLSVAARKKIAAAQRARWARVKRAKK
jgi:hypothetical protein